MRWRAIHLLVSLTNQAWLSTCYNCFYARSLTGTKKQNSKATHGADPADVLYGRRPVRATQPVRCQHSRCRAEYGTTPAFYQLIACWTSSQHAYKSARACCLHWQACTGCQPVPTPRQVPQACWQSTNMLRTWGGHEGGSIPQPALVTPQGQIHHHMHKSLKYKRTVTKPLRQE